MIATRAARRKPRQWIYGTERSYNALRLVCALCKRESGNLPIYVCKPRTSLRELWPKLKRFGNDPTSGG